MLFAAYPSAVVYKEPGRRPKSNAVQHLLCGDLLRLLERTQDEWVRGARSW